MKLMDATTLAVIKSALDGTYVGGVSVGTLANNGVALAPFHDLERSCYPLNSQAELEQLKADIIVWYHRTRNKSVLNEL